MDNMLISNNLRKLIKLRKMTQVEVAQKIGLTRSGLYQMIEKGDFKTSTLENLAKLFNVPITYFFSDSTISESVLEVNESAKCEKCEKCNELKATIKIKNKIIEDLQFNNDALKLTLEILDRQIDLINGKK